MPNGHPDFETKEKPLLELFFEPVASAMEKFANRHNLRVTKYYHQFPSWDFTFRHPQLGVAKIEVFKETETTLEVNALWWFDDYDNFTRCVKKSEKECVKLNPNDLENVLTLAFQIILGWQFGTWDEKHSPEMYRRAWKPRSKERFEKDLEYYPIPHL